MLACCEHMYAGNSGSANVRLRQQCQQGRTTEREKLEMDESMMRSLYVTTVKKSELLMGFLCNVQAWRVGNVGAAAFSGSKR